VLDDPAGVVGVEVHERRGGVGQPVGWMSSSASTTCWRAQPYPCSSHPGRLDSHEYVDAGLIANTGEVGDVVRR
jgi:hypothetical protein